jgi:SPP1 gp7 family putative phage head morphogenesis protein
MNPTEKSKVAGPIPKEAIAFLAGKDIKPAASWKDAWAKEYHYAFYVAKMVERDLLADVQDSLVKAIEDGQTFRDWSKGIKDTFDKSGWSDYNGEAEDNPQRLRIVYDTNLRTARAAGQWERQNRVSDVLTHAQFNLGPRRVHTETCQDLDGLVLRADDPFWDTHSPPLHFGCGSGMRFMTTQEAESLGVDVAPEDDMVDWENDNGDKVSMPAGVHPGFGENPFKARERVLRELADEKDGGTWTEDE